MKTVKIFGYSDDNIEIRGDLGDDEFGAFGRWHYLHFNDGTVVKGGFSLMPDKGWHFEVVKLGENASVVTLDPEMEDGDHFSDVLEVKGNFTDVKLWEKESGPSKPELVDLLGDFSWRDLDVEQLAKVYATATAKN